MSLELYVASLTANERFVYDVVSRFFEPTLFAPSTNGYLEFAASHQPAPETPSSVQTPQELPPQELPPQKLPLEAPQASSEALPG
jgi:hypothetical protein